MDDNASDNVSIDSEPRNKPRSKKVLRFADEDEIHFAEYANKDNDRGGPVGFHGASNGGQSRSGKRCGYGIWKTGCGTELYKGQWMQNMQHGRGKRMWGDGSVYNGQYKMGMKEGRGLMVWPDGRYYNGQWHQGVRS